MYDIFIYLLYEQVATAYFAVVYTTENGKVTAWAVNTLTVAASREAAFLFIATKFLAAAVAVSKDADVLRLYESA